MILFAPTYGPTASQAGGRTGKQYIIRYRMPCRTAIRTCYWQRAIL